MSQIFGVCVNVHVLSAQRGSGGTEYGGGGVVVVVGGSVPACGWSAGQGDTGQMKGSDVLTRPHSHFQQANKCHFSMDFNGKKKIKWM